MQKINLLPEGFGIKESSIKLSKNLKRIAVFLFIFLLAVFVASIGTFIFMRAQVNQSIEKKAELEIQIKALEETEKRLFLVKDRLRIVDDIYNSDNSFDEAEKLAALIERFDQDVVVDEVSIKEEVINLSIIAPNTLVFVDVIDYLKISGIYSAVTLVKTEFDNKDGFKAEYELEVNENEV